MSKTFKILILSIKFHLKFSKPFTHLFNFFTIKLSISNHINSITLIKSKKNTWSQKFDKPSLTRNQSIKIEWEKNCNYLSIKTMKVECQWNVLPYRLIFWVLSFIKVKLILIIMQKILCNLNFKTFTKLNCTWLPQKQNT